MDEDVLKSECAPELIEFQMRRILQSRDFKGPKSEFEDNVRR